MNPWEATHPVSLEEARGKILREFPEMEPLAIELVGTGFDHTVYMVNNRWVFRFPRRELGLEAMKIEKGILTQLDHASFQSPFQIPKPWFYGRGREEEYPFVGFEYVRGHVLVEEIDTDLLVPEVKMLGVFMRNLHGLQAESFVLQKDELERLSSRKRKWKLVEILQEISHELDLAVVAAAEDYIGKLEEWDNPPGSVIVHGDLHPKNLIVDGGKLCGVIDWGDAHIGHPAIDLSLVYQCIPIEHHGSFFETYGDVGERTKELAIFKAVFVSAVLLRYAVDTRDLQVKRWGEEGLRKALGAWQGIK